MLNCKTAFKSVLTLCVFCGYALAADDASTFADKELIRSFKYTPPEQCTTVRLDEDNGSMSKMPVLDQKDGQICWAYAGAQIFDAWSIKRNPNNVSLTSPAALAVKYATITGKPDLFKPESPISLLRLMNRTSLCALTRFGDYNNGIHSIDLLASLVEPHKAFISNADSKQFIERTNAALVKSGFPKTFSPGNPEVYRKQPNFIAFLDDVVAGICGETRSLSSDFPKVEYVAAGQFNGASRGFIIDRMRREAHRKLNEQAPLPIGITYCRAVLNNRDIVTLKNNGDLDRDICTSAIHTSVIVGRRLVYFKDKNGRKHPFCQFLVRDSFGQSCTKFPDDPEINPSKICEKGQVWVDEQALLRKTGEIYWLEEK